jgi:hypothetical protein
VADSEGKGMMDICTTITVQDLSHVLSHGLFADGRRQTYHIKVKSELDAGICKLF